MPTYDLNEHFEAAGEWYLPDCAGGKQFGVLQYDTKRIELHLHNGFAGIQESLNRSNGIKTYPIIYGITTKGEAVTILHAFQLNFSINYGTGGTRQPEKILVNMLIMGAHVHENFNLEKTTFQIPALNVWLSRRVINNSFSHDPDSNQISMAYSINKPDIERVNVSSINAEINWGYGWNEDSNPYQEIKFNVHAGMTVIPDICRPISWFFEQEEKLLSMLSFLAGLPMGTTRIYSVLADSGTDISIIRSSIKRQLCKFTNPYDFYMPRDKIDINLSDVIRNWFAIYEKIKQPCKLATSVMGSEGLWLHVEYLSLMQALEGFHRVMHDGTYMDSKDYEKVRIDITEAIPSKLGEDHKDALRARIRYGNEVSLQKRIEELARRLSDDNRRLIFGKSGRIPRSWIDTRNYYTHWDENLSCNILDSQAMYNVIVRLKHFLEALYLDLMGVSAEAINSSLIGSSAASQHLIQLNALEIKS